MAKGSQAIRRNHDRNNRGRLLTFLGASLLLLTFLAKEVFKERLKDLTDEISNTQNFNEVERQLQTVIGFNVDLTMSLQYFWHQYYSDKGIQNHYTVSGDVRAEMYSMDQWVAASRVRYERTTRLLNQLPGADVLRRQGDALRLLIEAEEHQSDQMSKKINATASPTQADIQDLAGLMVIYKMNETGAISQLEDRVLAEATKTRERYQTEYNWCRWVTYFCYVIGWSLALYGRLHGVSIDGAE